MDSYEFNTETENNSQQMNSKLFKNFTCSLCVKNFTSEKQYYGHLRIHSGEVLLVCDQCPESEVKFNSQAKLRVHENLCHNIVRPFKCQECALLFDRASQLEYHQRSVHLGEKSHICQICEKGFFRKTDLRTHLNIHLGTNISMCEICGKKFNHVSNLIRHCRTHTGIKPYPCTVCGKRFTQISSLARHKRIHDRVKSKNNINFQESVNSSHSNLKDYVKESKDIATVIGTGLPKVIKRQHYCKICGESFQFALLLRKHEKEHVESANIFECKSCKGKFQNPEDIKEHSCKEEIFTLEANEKQHKNRSKAKRIILDEGNVYKEDNSAKIQNYSIISKDVTPNLNVGEQTMETVFYVKTGKMTHINLNEFEEVSSHFLRDHVMEFANISDLLNMCNNENIDFEKDVDHSNNYSEVNDLTTEVPKLLNSEIASEIQIDVKNYVSRKQECKENLKHRQTEESNMLEFEENNTVQYFLNTESQDSQCNLQLESVNPKEILTNNEPTLRLVQIETGEQFYELVMDNISEKPQTQNFVSLESTKETVNESGKCLQDLELFKTDAQTNFETYGQGNFERFNKSNYENCAKEFLDLMHSEKQKEGKTICYAENGEQFLEMIESPDFTDSNNKEEGKNERIESIALKETFLSTVKDGKEFEKNDDITQILNEKEAIKSKSGKDKSGKEKNNKEFHCYVCQKTLSSKYNFTQHMGTHYVNHQRFHCKECAMSFAWKSTLNKHNESNHRPEGRQTYVCNICPKVYNNLSQVNEHVKRDHLKERKHACPLCGKSFFKKFDLKTHFRTHTNEKPYQCSSCEKSFHHQSHLIRHERIHSGEKPYTCNICQRSFCQPGSLKAHKLKHRPIKLDIFKKYQMDEDDPIDLFT